MFFVLPGSLYFIVVPYALNAYPTSITSIVLQVV